MNRNIYKHLKKARRTHTDHLDSVWTSTTNTSECACCQFPVLAKGFFVFIIVMLKTNCRWCNQVLGVNNALRPIWIKNLNSGTQCTADTLRHLFCAVIHFLQRNWTGHQWCHLNNFHSEVLLLLLYATRYCGPITITLINGPAMASRERAWPPLKRLAGVWYPLKAACPPP